MKRWLSWILMAAVVISALTVGATAAELKDENFQYEKVKVGTEDAYKVVKYIGDSKTQTAEIPSTFMSEDDEAPLEVVQIAGGAFANVRTLTKLIIPGQITGITADIFAGTYLKEIEFRNYAGNESDPVPHIEIGKGAFENCTELKTVTLSNSVAEIKENAFKGCSNLRSIVIPESVTAVGKDAFANTDLTSVTFLRSTTDISGAFPWSQLEIIHCPQSSNPLSVCKRLDYLNVGAKHIVHTFKDYNYDITSMPYPCQSGGVVKLSFTCPGYDYIETVTTPNPEAGKDPITTTRTVHVDCTYTDKDCYKNGSFSMTQSISPIPHTAGETGHVEGKAATCLEAGYTDSWTCTVCGEPFVQAEIIPKLEHQFDASSKEGFEITKEPTCTEKGEKTITKECKLCKQMIPQETKEEIEALGHDYLDFAKVDAADFEDSEDREFFEERLARAVTCTQKGEIGYRRLCTRCKEPEECLICEQDADKTNPSDGWTAGSSHHVKVIAIDLDDWNIHPADKITAKENGVTYAAEDGGPYDCTKGGKRITAYECKECQHELRRTEDVAAGVHAPDKPEKITPADCTHPARVEIVTGTKCTVCNETIPAEIHETGDPLGHSWGPFQEGTPPGTSSGTTGDDTTGGDTTGGDTTGGDTTGGTTGTEGTETGANGVSLQADGGEEDEGTASAGGPSCGTETQVHGYVQCTRCGAILERTLTVPATGKHTWGEWTVVKAATATEDGLQERVCSVCGKKDTQVLPATGSGSSGDPSTPGSPSTPSTPSTPTVTYYTITILSTSNGAVTSSSYTARRGDRVTLTVQPGSGYELDWMRVTTSSGSVCTLDGLGGGLYRFTMPSSNVEVRSTFTQTYTPSWATSTPSTGATSQWTDPSQTVIQGVPRAGTAGQIYSDIPASHWASGEINWATNMGYMTGSRGRFNPNGTITFQQMWMVLARLTGGRPANMAEARNWAVLNGFAEGGNPTHTVARHQLVTALYRTAHVMGSTNNTTVSLAGYPDSRTVPTAARTPMAWAVANGIVGGNANGRLDPYGTLTRAQFAVILYRFAQRV